MDTRSQKEADALSFASGWNTEKHVPSFIVGPPSSSRADISLNAAMSTCPAGFEGRLYHQDFDQKLGGGGAETTSHPDQRRQPGFRNDAGLPKCFVTAQHSLDPGCRHPLRRGESSAGKARFRSPADSRKLKTSPRRRSTGEGGRVVLALETGTGHEALSRTNVVPCVPAGKLRADVDGRRTREDWKRIREMGAALARLAPSARRPAVGSDRPSGALTFTTRSRLISQIR